MLPTASNTKANRSGGLHHDHRRRLRERMIYYGAENFADHELLEIVLFAANPRGNTNELAHRVMEQFGSVYAAMEAQPDELIEVCGLGESGVVQLMCLAELSRRYIRSSREPGTKYDTVQKIAEYMWSYFSGLDHERLYMMLLDNCMGLIDLVHLSDGGVSSTGVPTRQIIEKIVRKKPTFVVLSHNHPHGMARPSENDLEVTWRVGNAISLINVTLLEHIVIADDRFFPILKQQHGFPNMVEEAWALRGKTIDFDCFYNVDENTYLFSDFFKN